MVYKKNIVVAIKVDGKILGEDGEYITLPFGSEYSILVKNLNSRKALVGIEIDGKDVLDGDKLILEANTDIELEGFKKGNRVTNRFKFIEKTEEISDNRGDRIDDGLIRVEVTYEKEYKYSWDNKKEIEYHHHYYSNQYVYPYWIYNPPFQTDDMQWSFCMNAQNEVIGSSGNSNLRASNCCFSNTSENDKGITAKGNNNSNQEFITGYINTLEKDSHVIILRLRGTRNKKKVESPVFVKTKVKCDICGKTSKQSVKFCFNCGNCLK